MTALIIRINLIIFLSVLISVNECLKLSGKKYIRTEQGKSKDINTVFIETSHIRLHTQNHITEAEVLLCEEEGNTDCYLSTISICIDSQSKIWPKLLYKGDIPHTSNSLMINKRLAKRLNIGIGDHIGVKTAISFDDFVVCGIMRNFYGFPDYDKNAYYYCLFDRNESYKSKISGTYYTFSDDDKNAFIVESINQKIQNTINLKTKYALVIFLIIALINFFTLRGIQKVFTQRKYYNRLLILGKTRFIVNRIIIKDMILFMVISLFFYMCFLIFSPFLFINFCSILISVFINYLLLIRKLNGFNKIRK